MKKRVWKTMLVGLVGTLGGFAEPAPAPADEDGAKKEEKKWVSLVPAKDKGMGDWKLINFGGEGEIGFNKKGVLTISEGAELSGVVWGGKLPEVPYEIELEARRVSGVDFFCGLTLPVAEKTSVTFVAGGWGGGVVGISSIDGFDASENETTDYMAFKDDEWYTFRVRVQAKKLEAWVGEKQVAEVDTEGKKLGLRFGDIDRCAPLGLATWQTTSELRKIRWRKLEK